MKKFLNSPETLLEESLDGLVAAHADIVVAGGERKFICRKVLKPGKVALISGGGSGHEPLHAEFVGLGMLDAACPGQIFTSPTPDQIIAAVEAVDQSAGVILIVKNYEGDVMNFEMAAEMTEGRCAIVVTDDDVAVETSTYSTGRRGVAGTLIVEKIVGARRGNGAAVGQTSGVGSGGEQGDALDGRGLDVMYRPRGRQAEFRTRRLGGRDGRRYSWGTRSTPHPPAFRPRDGRGDGQGNSHRSGAEARGQNRSCSSMDSAGRPRSSSTYSTTRRPASWAPPE